jgi:dihydroflavonol-4-reductase
MSTSEIHVAVTGATGFVASHIVDQLLDKDNVIIHATVRSLNSATRNAHLTNLAQRKNKEASLKLFEASLDKEGSFDEAIEGCQYVMHTASPYIIDVQDPQKDLVDPALNGTLNVLRSCLKHNVKRVVLTSSLAAVTDSPDNNHIYSELDWNTESALDRNPYYYSKVLAEKAAWKFVKENPQLELLTINPCVVWGPELSTDSVNQSNKIFQQLCDGSLPALINLGWAIVDVRDVAKAHILAMETERQYTPGDEKQGRYLCANETKPMDYVVSVLQKIDNLDAKLPSWNFQNGFGNALMRVASVFQPKYTGQYIRTNLGKLTYCNNKKITEELGLSFIPVDQTIRDTVEDLISKGHLKGKLMNN